MGGIEGSMSYHFMKELFRRVKKSSDSQKHASFLQLVCQKAVCDQAGVSLSQKKVSNCKTMQSHSSCMVCN